ncbi:sugar phosphate isomerase/epimerase [Murimonas intestini]|uniref:sugar phosphate isomerase/epimerase n=1 Tax=Murimonas intestini TaxID=1337051 RepID=UPI00214C08F3|nr:sugar phosphate isomerase/epimerase [Murimonas intestini]MCR1865868.1 sugar phosphate isomerase/epimerase [Murimonas intestini]MCR1883288.1 sugar phosphate isomerase/epimerase [Murimonas intestini]
MLKRVDYGRVGFCYDCCHHSNYNPDDDLLSMYGKRLMALHLHDNGGKHSQHQLPFDGGIDWPCVMRKIAQTGYTGATALESMNWDYLDLTAEKFLQEAYVRAKRLDAFRLTAF